MPWQRVDPIAQPLNARLSAALVNAVNDTTAAAAIEAKSNHPSWRNRTGVLEGSIRFEPATQEGMSIIGSFGSYDVEYAIYQELGTRYIAAGHFLRNAADIEFPSLGAHIRERLV